MILVILSDLLNVQFQSIEISAVDKTLNSSDHSRIPSFQLSLTKSSALLPITSLSESLKVSHFFIKIFNSSSFPERSLMEFHSARSRSYSWDASLLNSSINYGTKKLPRAFTERCFDSMSLICWKILRAHRQISRHRSPMSYLFYRLLLEFN